MSILRPIMMALLAVAMSFASAARAQTPRRMAELYPESRWSAPWEPVVFDDKLVFTATASDSGRQLVRFDGRQTSIIDLPRRAGTPDSYGPSKLTVFQGRLVFEYEGDEYGQQLWSYDGQNVKRVTDYPGGTYQPITSQLVEFNDRLYFVPWDDDHGQELWAYDGTSARLALDLAPGPESSSPQRLTVWRDALYFSTRGAEFDDQTLWRFDGEKAEPAPGFTTYGTGVDTVSIDSYFRFTTSGSDLYFVASQSNRTRQLWRCDGQTMAPVMDFVSCKTDPVVYDGLLYFFADDASESARLTIDEFVRLAGQLSDQERSDRLSSLRSAGGVDLWSFDGTNATRLTDDQFQSTVLGYPGQVFPFCDGFIFSAYDRAGQELWYFDGKSAIMAADLNQQPDELLSRAAIMFPGSSAPSSFIEFQGRTYFSATDGIHGRELWVLEPPRALPEPTSHMLLVSAAACLLCFSVANRRRCSSRAPGSRTPRLAYLTTPRRIPRRSRGLIGR